MREQEQVLKDLKMDIAIGKGILGLYVALSLGSSSAVVTSLPIVFLGVLPHWAELAMAGGGALFVPGSIHGVSLCRRWLAQANQTIKSLESQNQPNR